MTAIAVREQVYPYQFVMKPSGDFIGVVGLVSDPVTHIIEELPKFGGNAVGFDADILAGLAVCSGPFPDPSEHAFVQVIQEFFRQHIALAVEGPFLGFEDISLFRFV
jgi:hypothetical protein